MYLYSYVGSVIVASTYLLLALNIIKDKSKYFFGMILIGNILFAIHSLKMHTYPVLLLNIGFIFFAIMALTNTRLKVNWINFKFFLLSLIITICCSLYLNSEKNTIIETLGWFSMIGGFGSYFLYSQQKIPLMTYFLINMLVNITFSTYLYQHNNYPYMALQLLVFFISLIGVLKIIKKQHYLCC